jgi:hypothetical protein
MATEIDLVLQLLLSTEPSTSQSLWGCHDPAAHHSCRCTQKANHSNPAPNSQSWDLYWCLPRMGNRLCLGKILTGVVHGQRKSDWVNTTLYPGFLILAQDSIWWVGKPYMFFSCCQFSKACPGQVKTLTPFGSLQMTEKPTTSHLSVQSWQGL